MSHSAQAVEQMPQVSHHKLQCIGCGANCAEASADFRCENCGDLFEAVYDWPEIEAETVQRFWLRRRTSLGPLDQSGVWRFRDFLPILQDLNHVITLREGNTPLYQMPGGAKSAGVETLLAKHQGMNPTGSFKDTGMTAAISVAKEKGFRWVACASTGNTSASMAAYAARAGMRSLVLIPEGKIAWGKLAQSLEYGAVTLQLRTDFDGCVNVLTELVHRYPIYLLNSMNPYRLEGQKTLAFELLEQLEWEAPDHIVVPGGNLANSSAIGKGMLELHRAGLIRRLPQIHVIQAEGANALVRTVRETGGKKLVPVKAETLATAIRIGNPASWKKAVRVVEATGGSVEQVTETEIAVAKAEIGEDGIGCEPASAATLAGLKKLVAQGLVRKNESVVLVLTGHVLKDPEYSLKFHQGELLKDTGDQAAMELHRRPPIVLDGTVDAVLPMLESAGKNE
ncbi:MAG TPA: threonine synthase [Terriglobales bacterium]|nr:threonine synthase [Terriglobales bacterium]